METVHTFGISRLCWSLKEPDLPDLEPVTFWDCQRACFNLGGWGVVRRELPLVPAGMGALSRHDTPDSLVRLLSCIWEVASCALVFILNK